MTENKDKKSFFSPSRIFLLIGVICLLASATLTYQNLQEDKNAGSAAVAIVQEVNKVEAEAVTLVVEADEEVIPNYILNPDMDMPETEIDGKRYIGTLSIPVIEVELPVMTDWSYPQLKIAPCRYMGSAYTNDMIIAAHNYRTHFGSLYLLEEGDELSFTDVEGNVFRYTVADVETIDKYDIEKMDAGEWDMTLFTCTLGGKSRVTVRCDLVTDETV